MGVIEERPAGDEDLPVREQGHGLVAADAYSRSRKATKYDLAGFSQGRLEVTLASSADGNSRIGLQLERNGKERL